MPFPAMFAVTVPEFLNKLLVILANMPGLGGYGFTGFHVTEPGTGVKIELVLLPVQNMKYNDFLFIMPEMFQPVKHLFRCIK